MNLLRQGFRKLSSEKHTDKEVTRGHFRSRDKDGGHTTGSAIPEDHMARANLMALSVIEPDLQRLRAYDV